MKKRVIFICAASTSPSLDPATLGILETAIKIHEEKPADIFYISGKYVPGDPGKTAVKAMREWLFEKGVKCSIKWEAHSQWRICSEISVLVNDFRHSDTNHEIVVVDVPHRAERLWYLLHSTLKTQHIKIVEVELELKVFLDLDFCRQFLISWLRELQLQFQMFRNA